MVKLTPTNVVIIGAAITATAVIIAAIIGARWKKGQDNGNPGIAGSGNIGNVVGSGNVVNVSIRYDVSSDAGTSALAELKALLQNKERSLHDRLVEKFPYGYVLFADSKDAGVFMPFYKEGVMRMEADWVHTTFQRQQGSLLVTVPKPRWNSSNIHIQVRAAVEEFAFTPNQEMPFHHVVSGGQPRAVFEILEPDPAKPVYVIGFKLLSP